MRWLIVAGAAVWAALCALFYPGLMNVDSGELLSQGVMHAYVDWHTPLLSVIWARLPAPAALLAVGIGLYVAGAVWAAAHLAETFPGRLLCLLALCLWPPLSNDLGLMGRDSALIACFMPFIAVLIAGRRTWLGVPLFVLAVAFRPDSAIAMLPGLALLLPGRLGWAKALALFVLCYAAIGWFNHRVLMARPTFPIQTTLIHDLGGISYAVGEDLMPDYADPGFGMDEIRQRYHPRFGDPLMFDPSRPNMPISFDPGRHAALAKAWEQAVAAHPLVYLRHRLATFKALIDIDPPEDHQLYQLNTDGRMKQQFPALAGMNLANPDSAAMRLYRGKIMPVLARGSVFRGYAYDLLILLELALAALRWRRSDRLILALGAGALMHQAVLLLVSPAALFRYLYPSVLCTLVMTLLSLSSSPCGSDRSAA
jgi:hypothetical protein